MKDLVIGVDASTTSVKAIAFTRSGEVVAEARAGYSMQSPKHEYFEQNPDDWWQAAVKALRVFGLKVLKALLRP